MPELPDFELPELKMSLPLDPAIPLLTVTSVNIPLLEPVPSPLHTTTLPPVCLVPLPACIARIPPSPLVPLPTCSEIEPPRPNVAGPVPKVKVPLLPDEEEPVLNRRWPLVPKSPLLAVDTLIVPLLDAVPSPLFM